MHLVGCNWEFASGFKLLKMLQEFVILLDDSSSFTIIFSVYCAFLDCFCSCYLLIDKFSVLLGKQIYVLVIKYSLLNVIIDSLLFIS